MLLVATITVVMMSTDAAYHSAFSFSGEIKTAAFDLAANGTGTASQNFDELRMEPNKDYTRTIKIDTSKCDVDRMDVFVTLNVQTTGTVPFGFMITMDGEAAGNGTAITLADAQKSVNNMVLGFRWNLGDGEDAQTYKDFSFSYTVTVEGRQKQ